MPIEPSLLTLARAAAPDNAWLPLRWWTTHHADDLAASLRLEWGRELRRQAGDERLPSDLRGWLRERARRALTPPPIAADARFPRRWLHGRTKPPLPAELVTAGAAGAVAAGIAVDRPIVVIDVRRRPDACVTAAAWLVDAGYAVVRIGDVDPFRVRGVVDLATSPARTRPLELFLVYHARFVLCDALDAQHVATLVATPSLLLNARDPFSGYPVLAGSLFTLSTAVDLDTGAVLPISERTTERFLRNLRNYGFRANRSSEVLAAVGEMHAAFSGERERSSQASYRARVTMAGVALANEVPLVAEWGPDEGFLGDGRIAAWQADAITVGEPT